MEITPSMFLRRAADVLEEDGWCQYYFTNEEGAHCTRGALSTTLIELRKGGAPYGASEMLQLDARDALKERTNGALMFWNDVPGRTKEEVLALLRNTADELEVVEHAERLTAEATMAEAVR